MSRWGTAQDFPYMAYVNATDTYVRSGPGQRYYPTSKVQQGFAVEVYRHDAEGWCAIRPPQGSFSWLASHQVRPVDSGVVEIIDDNVVTRVGSTLSPSRSAVQVLLPRGERLELSSTGAEDDPRWVKVAAPAGEFRWIAASALSRQPPIEVEPPPRSAEPLPQSNGAGWTRQSLHSDSDEPDVPNAFDHLSHSNSGEITGLRFDTPARAVEAPSAEPISSDPNAMEVVAGSPAEFQLTQFQAQTVPPTLPQNAPATNVAPTNGMESTRPRVRFQGLTPPLSSTVGSVEELELRLSQAVVKPPQQWELDPLETAANSLLANTATPPVRAQLREVLGRITRFQEVQDRYNNPTPTIVPERDPFEASPQVFAEPQAKPYELTGLSASVRERIQEDLEAQPRASAGGLSKGGSPATVTKPLYDAAGLLKPVVSKREAAPQYALVDEQGKVVSFVTPTPDLNLKPYVGRRIGVHGKRGFMPEYRRAHVTAGRVTPIDQTLRR